MKTTIDLPDLVFRKAKATAAESGISLKTFITEAEALPVLFADFGTIGHYAHIADGLKRKGRTITHNDVWIAALAMQHGLPVLSRDKQFDFVDGLPRLFW